MPTRPRPSAAAALTNAAHEYYLEQHATSEVGHRLNVSCQLCVLPSFHFTVEHRYCCNSPTTGASLLAECDYLIGNTAEWVDDEVNEGLLICFILVMRFSLALALSSSGEIAWNMTWFVIIAVWIRFERRFLVRLAKTVLLSCSGYHREARKFRQGPTERYPLRRLILTVGRLVSFSALTLIARFRVDRGGSVSQLGGMRWQKP